MIEAARITRLAYIRQKLPEITIFLLILIHNLFEEKHLRAGRTKMDVYRGLSVQIQIQTIRKPDILRAGF